MRRVRDDAPPAVQNTYEFVLWLVKKVENFPKAQRFTIGERLTANGLDLLTTLVEAAYTRNKEHLLELASRRVNATRYLLRMAEVRPADTIMKRVGRQAQAARMWRRSCLINLGPP